jgi:uncharacterized protein (UPF0303 family)
MTVDHAKMKHAIEADEVALATLPLDSASLVSVATTLLSLAPIPVTVKIVLGRRTVVLLSADGMAMDNERFLDLKINTVFNCGHSSLWWFHHLRGTGRTLADVAWADPQQVIDMGGGVPLFAHGQIVGAIAISGLPHEEDHALIMRAVESVKSTTETN